MASARLTAVHASPALRRGSKKRSPHRRWHARFQRQSSGPSPAGLAAAPFSSRSWEGALPFVGCPGTTRRETPAAPSAAPSNVSTSPAASPPSASAGLPTQSPSPTAAVPSAAVHAAGRVAWSRLPDRSLPLVHARGTVHRGPRHRHRPPRQRGRRDLADARRRPRDLRRGGRPLGVRCRRQRGPASPSAVAACEHLPRTGARRPRPSWTRSMRFAGLQASSWRRLASRCSTTAALSSQPQRLPEPVGQRLRSPTIRATSDGPRSGPTVPGGRVAGHRPRPPARRPA